MIRTLACLVAGCFVLHHVVSLGFAQELISTSVKPLDTYLAEQQLSSPYAWSIESNDEKPGYTRIAATMTSGQWQGTTWTHDIRLFRPSDCPHPDSAILFINGGSNDKSPSQGIEMACMALAGLSGMPVIAIFQVPNQPLLDGLKEDELIAASWLKYLETEDESWPLLFPMVNSAVRAMDCATEISVQAFKQPINQFIITGASKRGWTSWLTAAADERIIGVAPMVIDTLNFRKQIQDQKSKWGYFSEQISDYTEAGLINLGEESAAETKLRMMMDPYEYRDRLTMPKLIINGANDRYWRCDALDNYWPELLGTKNVLTLANAGHSLEGGESTVTTTTAMFARRCAQGLTLPKIHWKTSAENDKRTILFEAHSDEPVENFVFWVAFSNTRDFRDANFEKRPADAREDERATIRVSVPTDRHVAVFADLMFDSSGHAFQLSTGVSQPSLD